jgi:hypothetical protein
MFGCGRKRRGISFICKKGKIISGYIQKRVLTPHERICYSSLCIGRSYDETGQNVRRAIW